MSGFWIVRQTSVRALAFPVASAPLPDPRNINILEMNLPMSAPRANPKRLKILAMNSASTGSSNPQGSWSRGPEGRQFYPSPSETLREALIEVAENKDVSTK